MGPDTKNSAIRKKQKGGMSMTIRENYEQWLRDFANDPETIRDLEAIRDDEKEMEDRFYTELSFGTAGMRGVLGAGMNRMNKYNVRRATKGLAGLPMTAAVAVLNSRKIPL